MTEENKSVKNFPNRLPKLRFTEFKGGWENKRLGELLEFKNGINASKEQYGSGIKFINVLDILSNDFITYENIVGKVNVDEATVEKFLVSYGDILFQRSSETREEVGTANVYLDKNKNATFGGFVIRGRKIGNYNPIFFNKLLKTTSARESITSKSGGSTRFNVGQEILNSVNLYFPNLFEQEKIALFLSLVDNRIQTQRKIIEDLIILKSNTAQNIFNQVFKFKDSEGIDFPNWQIKRLGDVCEIKRGASPRPISDSKWFDEDSKIGWVRISDVTRSDKYLEKTEQYLSNAGISKSRLVKKGNMIMSICATIGKPIYTNFDVCIHDGFVVFENLTLNKEFLYYYLDFIQLNWYKYGQPGIQVNLNSEIVNNEFVVVPVIEEQIKIAEFLSKFDEKIKLENELLTQYENQKKYLLKNLFV